MAQHRISPEVTMNGFKTPYISSTVDGNDEDMLQSGSKRSECEENEGTDCEDREEALIGKGK
jgi:hypothetical protein